MATFRSFPAPIGPDDIQLVDHAGTHYRCSGCAGAIPDGVWLHEVVDRGNVVGLVARVGSDGPVVHRCGRQERDDG